MVNYSNSKIYKIVCDSKKLTYYGSTTQRLSKRLSGHKANYKKYLAGNYSYTTSFEVVKHNDCKIYLVESFECKNKEELHKKERHYIENNNCVNKNIPTRTIREYQQDNKEQIKAYKKEYNKQKHICICGSVYRKDSKSRHIKTKKHKQFVDYPPFLQNMDL